MDRFAFEFSQPLSWPLALVGVTPWTAHVDVSDDEFAVRFGPWTLTTPLSNVEGASKTGPYLPFKVIGPHVSLADRGATFGTTWRRGVCVRFRRPVSGALPGGLLTHPAVTVTVAEPDRLVALLERRPEGAPGDGDELRLVSVPAMPAGVPADAADAPATTDAGDAAPTPVATPPARRTPRPTATGTRRRTASRTGATGTGTEAATATASGTPGGIATGTATRTPSRRRPRATVPEHPTPADMPLHTPTEKVPGVTPPADEGLPGPDSES